MSGENTGSIGKAVRGGKAPILTPIEKINSILWWLDIFRWSSKDTPGPGAYFMGNLKKSNTKPQKSPRVV